MRTIFGWDRWRPALALLVLVGGLSVLVAACGSSNNDKTTSSSGGGGSSTTAKAASDVTKCGTKPGVKATGTPIKLGAIVTKQPGTDFTDGANMAQAYFNCVNDNGGINGHPISVHVRDRADRPGPDRRATPTS